MVMSSTPPREKIEGGIIRASTRLSSTGGVGFECKAAGHYQLSKRDSRLARTRLTPADFILRRRSLAAEFSGVPASPLK